LHPARRRGSTTLGPPELVEVAEGLARSAGSWPGVRRPVRRTWDLMVAGDAFEAWVIAWPPGGAIELHDHGDSAGAVVVARGKLLETTVVPGADGTLETKATLIRAGTSLSFEGAHVHDIVNAGRGCAISVHVYSPRLTAMTFYEVTDDRLVPGRTDRYHLGGRAVS
ncbi:MAG TPA: cysteine dioxygenase family protein, partial [Acidimicrobiales bacterium]|nr:cysteine dioxygenase family protein [Acidimicrobiales bacterium]